jgi:hypothetical protein
LQPDKPDGPAIKPYSNIGVVIDHDDFDLVLDAALPEHGLQADQQRLWPIKDWYDDA